MKTINRVLLIAAILGVSMLGSFLAGRIGVEKVQAAPVAALGVPVKLTLLDVPNVSSEPDVFGTSAVKVADVGVFTVENSASLVEVTYQGRLLIDGVTGNGVYFELRVDGTNGISAGAGQPSGMGLVRSTEAGQYVSNTFSGFWQGLPAGDHTVSIWVRASSGNGDNAIIDPGGWASNIVSVKEYLPLGSTYVPYLTR